jgi:hypothetical protein
MPPGSHEQGGIPVSGNPILRTIAVGACAALLVAALAGPALAADKSACKKGAWKDAMTADGQSFKSAGRCIKYVRRGGDLALAVAYSDLDGDHTFSSGDVLINRLVDTNGDGIPSAGDTIELGQYPIDFTLTNFASFDAPDLIVTDVDQLYYGEIAVTTANWANRLEWHGHPASEGEYYSEWVGVVHTGIHDRFNDAIPADYITADPGTPSQPALPVLGMTRTQQGDDRFIDVHIYGL